MSLTYFMNYMRQLPEGQYEIINVQIKSNIDRYGYTVKSFVGEGLSTRNAEYYGWSMYYAATL